MLTAAPAWAVGRESELGTLEVGKRAELTAYSKNLMTVEPPEIPKAIPALTNPALTITAGRITHRA
jgi:predicted amidohydrolase YtcJ